MPPMYRIEIDPEHPERALETEWLLTNGLGGYAMGTALGVNTRRYHGLLVAALEPPVRRIVALHSLIEEIAIGEQTLCLSTAQFGDDFTLHPRGFAALESFEFDHPIVRWTYRFGSVLVTRQLVIAEDGQEAAIFYDIRNRDEPARIRIRPMMPLRSAHAIDSEKGVIRRHDDAPTNASCIYEVGDLAVRLAELQNDCGSWVDDAREWGDFAYSVDDSRRQPFLETIYSPGYVEVEGTGALLSVEVVPRCTLKGAARALREDRSPLSAASGHFLVRRPGAPPSESIVAGYPWFTDWGRDAMISMPGIMLCNRRYAEAKSMLLSFARHMRNGLIPNHFDDHTGEALYNTVDASLWLVYTVYQLWREVGGELEGVQELFNACRAIVHAYREGTDFNIFMDDDGLIAAGDESTQLTWMDAKRDGVVFTPRHGKAVEISALWFNALHCLAAMTENSDERCDLLRLAERVGESFRAKFWWAENKCLHDVLTPAGDGAYRPDGKLRPNQIFAVSLPHSPLMRDEQLAIVDLVRVRFLTPYGLRTLDRDDPEYRGRYEGDMMQRDAAYHNGTAWPWLIGPYCESLLRVNDFDENSKRACREAIRPLIDSMQTGCLGQIAEVYDGDPPQRPDGCPAQAWSVAEVLRIRMLVEQPPQAG